MGLEHNNFVIGNGASELIYVLMYTLKPSKLILPIPTFSEYANAAHAVGVPITNVPLSGNSFNELEINSLQIEENSLIILCNPNNPTSTLYNKQFLETLLVEVENKKAWLMMDESFIDYIANKENYSLIKDVNSYSRLIILYSLTKFFALPGVRLGCIVTNPDLATLLTEHKDPWSVNCFALEVADVVLGDKEYYDNTYKYNVEARDMLYQGVKQIRGLIPFQPNANYVFVEIDPNISTATQLCEYLGKQGILLRNCNTYPLLGEKYVRIAVKSKGDILHLLNKLQEWETSKVG